MREQGVKAAYALVTVPNAASEHLHEKPSGSTRMGDQKNAGVHLRAWRDIAWLVPRHPVRQNPSPSSPSPRCKRAARQCEACSRAQTPARKADR